MPDVADSSIRRSDSLAAAGLTIAATPAIAGDGQAFTGGTERLVSSGVDITSTGLTMSGCVNRGVSVIDQRLVAKTASEGNSIYELLIDGGTNEAVAHVHTGGSTREARGGTVGVGTWHQLTATWNGASLVLYVDGVPVDTIAAPGTLPTNPDIPLVIGNIASADRGLKGTLDNVAGLHRSLTAAEVATAHRTQNDPATTPAVGAQQTGAANPWTVAGNETHSGSFSLQAPTAGPGSTAWATDTDTGTGLSPTNQFETSLTSPAGYDLARLTGATRTPDAPPAGTTAPGTWIKVTPRTDQNGDTTVLVDDVETIAATNQGAIPATGSIGLRAGLLPGTENWYIDDVQARRLITPEPTTALGPLDRQ